MSTTILQPWAWYISHGPKRIENRTWAPPASIRGQYLAIHAGKRMDDLTIMEAQQFVRRIPTERLGGKIGAGYRENAEGKVTARDLSYGAIVAVARVVAHVTVSESPWFVGPIGWVLDEVTAIEPVPCRGAQGVWTVPDAELALVRARWKAAITFQRGRSDCYQDRCENVPFASVGGLGSRSALVTPKYIAPDDAADYLRGYEAQARELYGDDWRTCEFGWKPALTIGGAP